MLTLTFISLYLSLWCVCNKFQKIICKYTWDHHLRTQYSYKSCIQLHTDSPGRCTSSWLLLCPLDKGLFLWTSSRPPPSVLPPFLASFCREAPCSFDHSFCCNAVCMSWSHVALTLSVPSPVIFVEVATFMHELTHLLVPCCLPPDEAELLALSSIL